MRIYETQSHRNGVAANGFTVMRFDGRRHGGSRNMLAVIFAERGNVAVFDLNLLAQNNIKFGENSWRGDLFEKELRAVVDDDPEVARVSIRESDYNAQRKALADLVAANNCNYDREVMRSEGLFDRAAEVIGVAKKAAA